MREIKFRAWNKKEMVLTNHPSYLITFHGDLYTVDNVNGVTYYKNDEWILMQYTGLKDKNGKEIYEGDIIRWGDTEIEAIIWNEGMASFTLNKSPLPGQGIKNALVPLGMLNNDKYEVIGNLYQNPDLLNETK